MKKNIIISVIVCFIIVIGFIGFIFWNNKIVSIITLDINPSVKINLTRNEKVKSIEALNDDAKDIISNNLKGKSLDDTLKLITNNLVDKGYVEDGNVAILLYSNGNIKNEDIESKIKDIFNDKEMAADIIIVDNITKKDEEIAKKYNISPAKASYINSIKEDNDNIDIDSIKDKSVDEIRETKETGRYCDKDYFLEGDWCLKEIDRVTASNGDVCPRGYLEYEGKCYEETGIEETGNLLCRDGFKLEGEECIKKTSVNAVVTGYTCSKGEVRTKGEVGQTVKGAGDANDPVCVDPSSKTHPVSPCQLPASDPTERMSYGGKCYWHRAPVIASGCPGKVQVNGFCWDEAVNVYLCPNGNNNIIRNQDDYCYTILKNIKPTPSSYKCDDGMTLNGNKCIGEEKEEAMPERFCQNGYTLVNNDRCINYKNITNKENGLICNQENARLKGNICVIYEIIEAKHS